MASYFNNSRAAVERAKKLATKTECPAYLMFESGDWVVYSTAEIEDMFATGDITTYEFNRDYQATVHP